MTERPSIFRGDTTPYVAVEIPEEDVLEGRPTMEMGPTWSSNDGSKISGFVRLTPGRFRFYQPHHESTYMLGGHMVVTMEDGHAFDLRAGDLIHLQPDSRCVLQVLEDVEDFFVISSPDGPVELEAP